MRILTAVFTDARRISFDVTRLLTRNRRNRSALHEGRTRVALAEQADLTFAQFVLLTPFPGTVDFDKWAAEENRRGTTVDGVPVTQHWLIPEGRRPRLYAAHPTMSLEQIRVGTQRASDRFYSWRHVWRRSRVVESVRARVVLVLVSKMYANTGAATDRARVEQSARRAR